MTHYHRETAALALLLAVLSVSDSAADERPALEPSLARVEEPRMKPSPTGRRLLIRLLDHVRRGKRPISLGRFVPSLRLPHPMVCPGRSDPKRSRTDPISAHEKWPKGPTQFSLIRVAREGEHDTKHRSRAPVVRAAGDPRRNCFRACRCSVWMGDHLHR